MVSTHSGIIVQRVNSSWSVKVSHCAASQNWEGKLESSLQYAYMGLTFGIT